MAYTTNGAQHPHRFDGAQGYVYIDQHEALDVRQYTLAPWVRTDGRTSDPLRQEILEKAGAYWLNIRNASHTLRAGGFFVGCRGQAYRTYLDTATAVPLQTWTHVAATYDGKALAIYLNGEQSLSKAEDRHLCKTNRKLLISAANNPTFTPLRKPSFPALWTKSGFTRGRRARWKFRRSCVRPVNNRHGRGLLSKHHASARNGHRLHVCSSAMVAGR